MSTFAVFGMSENWAREEAKEHTNTYKMENGKMVERTIAEWELAVEVEVARIMAGKKCVRLSPMFDAPPVRAAVHGDGQGQHRLSRLEDSHEGGAGRRQEQADLECQNRRAKGRVR
ncbi:hypothetical protein PMI21_05522 [Pseudomonas sp. GM18]|uniref:hypothetical protein n=1 Tax=Pseudomonas sp. GM18 TaxID=1144324 RepID=UPI00027249E6|nr:hypothetical protein [Pseudomonas sp. GM18]EJM09790.1 hypothetical protein PMI21_05522 [Pseudomonas sp. GM18]